jgi:membrane-associated phospholipid phosphatase
MSSRIRIRNGARFFVELAILAFVCAPHTVSANESEAASYSTYSLQGTLPVDLVATGTLTASWLLAETVLKKPLAPDTCRWCQSNSFDAAVRDSLKWNSAQTAATMSNIGTMAAVANAFGTLAVLAKLNDHPEDLALNSLYVLESVSFSMTVTNIVKVIVARERPAVHYESNYAESLSPAEHNLSFFSGHSAVTFSFVSAAGSVAVLRGYKHASWLWTIGLGVAAVTAYARVGADAHYATDVLTGATMGTLMGGMLPLWLHPRQMSRGPHAKTAVDWQPLVSPTAHSGALIGVQGTL